MKKIIVLLVFFISLFLVSCDKNKSFILTDDMIRDEIENLVNAKSYEVKFKFRVATEEMDLKFNPLYTVSKYTDNNDKDILKIKYNNKIIEGLGLEPLEILLDNHEEMVYLNNTYAWYKGSFAETEKETGLAFYDSSNSDNNNLDKLTNIINNSLLNFNRKNYVELINEDRKLVHYELEYNVYDILEEFYNIVKKDQELDLDDIIRNFDLEDIFELFKEFKVDVYFDIDNGNDIALIEIELMNILGSNAIVERIMDYIPYNNIDIKTILEYIEDIEIGLNIYNINNLDKINIPEDAKLGNSITYIDAPFNPQELVHLYMGDEDTIIFESSEEERWYTFTLDESTIINIVSISTIDPKVTVYDEDFNQIGFNDNKITSGNYMDFLYTEELAEGTYFFKVELSDDFTGGVVKVKLRY